MYKIRIVSDPVECKTIWYKVYPQENIFDLWEIRNCFAKFYRNPLYFIVAEDGDEIVGFLPLVFINELQSYGFFPGETWNSKTWIEQNKIVFQSYQIYEHLLENIPVDTEIRYLCLPTFIKENNLIAFDETGYLFFPCQYNYSINNYLNRYSNKRRKSLQKDLADLAFGGVKFRYNKMSDIDTMYDMCIKKYGTNSYFYDDRFINSFAELMKWNEKNNTLKITTVITGDNIIAVDVGVIWNNGYTVLAGAADNSFKGVSKLINISHLTYACEQRLQYVDFLCGDFGWKNNMHLTPRDLYKVEKNISNFEHVSPILQLETIVNV